MRAISSGVIAVAFAVVALTASGPGDAMAEDTLDAARSETAARLSRHETGELRCFPVLAGAAEAHVVYTYKGGQKVEPRQAKHPFRFVDLRVEATDKPALLVLTAYEPVVWRLEVAAGARIAGVLLSGYYEPLTLGLPQGVPLTRSFYQLRNGKDFEPCRMKSSKSEEGAQAEAQDPRAVLRDLEDALRRVVAAEREVLRLDGALEGVERAAAELRRSGAAASAQETLSVLAASLEDEAATARKERDRVQEQVASLQDRRARTPQNAKERLDAPSAFLANGFSVEDVDSLATLEQALAEQGSHQVASYQRRSGDDQSFRFEVSAAGAAAFRRLKAEGEAELAALSLPAVELLPASRPQLHAPASLSQEDALSFLQEKGYLLRNHAPLRDYYCARRRALGKSKGVDLKGCGLMTIKGIFTVVGPIIYPDGLCGAHSVTFFLPPGAPAPEGSPCHSRVIHLAERPCLGDESDCRLRQIKRERGLQ